MKIYTISDMSTAYISVDHASTHFFILPQNVLVLVQLLIPPNLQWSMQLAILGRTFDSHQISSQISVKLHCKDLNLTLSKMPVPNLTQTLLGPFQSTLMIVEAIWSFYDHEIATKQSYQDENWKL